MAKKVVTIARRDQSGKTTLPIDTLTQSVPPLLDEIQNSLLAKAHPNTFSICY